MNRQYERERESFSLHVVWIKKRRNIQDFFCMSSNRTLHLQKFIFSGSKSRSGIETLGLLFCQITSVQADPLLSSASELNVSLVRFSLVQFSSAGVSWVPGPPAAVRNRQYLFLSFCPSDYPPLHHTHVLPSGRHQVAVIVQEAHAGHVTAVATVDMAGSLERKRK